ncbi:MAG: hypothetical protein PF689_05025 [Deltaproteobacteria bacterium]|jgi:hypothetical protein|nr:hypothetical protein [Deltaproteobacteria bacterium]
MKKWILFSFFASLVFSNSVLANDAPVLKKIDSITVKKGYIDDQFSISSDGKYLAYITVNSQGVAKLHIKSQEKRTEKVVEITKITDEPLKIFFMNNKYINLVAKSGKYKDFTFFDLQGKKVGNINKVTDMIHKHAAKLITVFTKIPRASSTTYLLNEYEIPNFKTPSSKSRLSTSAGDTFILDKQKLKVSYFTPDYHTALVRIIGGYDEKSDSRLPDKVGFYNVKTKKLKKGGRIANNAKWDKNAHVFKNNAGYSNIIQLKGTPAVDGINGTFRFTTGPQQWKKVSFDFKLGRFNFKTLVTEKRSSNHKLYFSLIIDPQNPIILKQLKSEKRFIHFFELNTKTGKTRKLGRIKAEQGFVRWRINNNILLVMNLSKNWKVGSNQLDIYKIK